MRTIWYQMGIESLQKQNKSRLKEWNTGKTWFWCWNFYLYSLWMVFKSISLTTLSWNKELSLKWNSLWYCIATAKYHNQITIKERDDPPPPPPPPLNQPTIRISNRIENPIGTEKCWLVIIDRVHVHDKAHASAKFKRYTWNIVCRTAQTWRMS